MNEDNIGTEPQSIRQPEPEKDLVSWEAPVRRFKKRNRDFYSTITAIVFLLSVILFFAKEFLLIGAIMAIGFVTYILSSIEPENTKHIITNKGVRTAGKMYTWDELGRYWWDNKWNQKSLHVELPGQFPGEAIMLLGDEDQKIIDQHLKKYLIMEQPKPTWIDKAALWIQEKVPLESDDTPRPPQS